VIVVVWARWLQPNFSWRRLSSARR